MSEKEYPLNSGREIKKVADVINHQDIWRLIVPVPQRLSQSCITGTSYFFAHFSSPLI